jgi:hypothetical protein
MFLLVLLDILMVKPSRATVWTEKNDERASWNPLMTDISESKIFHHQSFYAADFR